LPALKKHRPDLRVAFLDCPPTGLVAITNLDPQSAILQQEYRSVLDEFGAVDLSSYGLKRLWSLFPTLDTRDLVATGTIGSVFSLREAGSCARILRTAPRDNQTADEGPRDKARAPVVLDPRLTGDTANNELTPCFIEPDGSLEKLEEHFTKIYRSQDWGHGSGVGARPDRTVEYRAFLQRFIIDNHVRSVVDLGCGDWQFSRHLDWSNVRYLGIDVVAAVIERNRREFAKDNIAFEEFESLATLPPADLLLCKDVLQHLPNELVKEYLTTFKTKYKFSLITNDDEPKDLQNIDIDVGGWRTLRLEREPFCESGSVVLAWTVPWGAATTRKSTFLLYGDRRARRDSGAKKAPLLNTGAKSATVGILAKACAARILVSITAHFDLARLSFLAEALRSLSDFPVSALDVVIITNTFRDDELELLRRLCSETLPNSNSSVRSYGNLSRAFNLTWCHKEIITADFHNTNDRYTHFIYLEDDVRMNFANFCYFLKYREILHHAGLLPSFLRVEYSSTLGGFVNVDQFAPVDVRNQPRKTQGDLFLVNMPNPYNACFILDIELADEYVRTPSFDCEGSQSVCNWGIRERAAMGLCFENVPEPFISRYLVPVSKRSGITPSYAWVSHLANNFAADASSVYGKIAMGSLFLNARSQNDAE
jgi:SAM-dependent methyltransferase